MPILKWFRLAGDQVFDGLQKFRTNAGRGGFGDTGEAHANYGLFVFILAKNFPGLRIHEMKPSTRQTGDRLVTVLTRFLSGIALYVLADFRAAVEERTH
jgi:hypothetical protein